MFSSTYAWVRSLVRIRAVPSPSPRSAVTSRCSCVHVGGQRGLVDGRGDAALGDDELAVAHAEPRRGRRRCRPSRARWRPGPSTGPCRTRSTSRAGSRPPSGRRRGPPSSDAAPMTCTRTTLVWPSASPTICVARSRHASATAASNAPRSAGGPARPEASRSTVSFVDVQPSTDIALKLSATPARSDCWSRAGIDVGVGGEHGEHRGHVRGEHRRALGHAADDEAGTRGRRSPCGRCRW